MRITGAGRRALATGALVALATVLIGRELGRRSVREPRVSAGPIRVAPAAGVAPRAAAARAASVRTAPRTPPRRGDGASPLLGAAAAARAAAEVQAVSDIEAIPAPAPPPVVRVAAVAPVVPHPEITSDAWARVRAGAPVGLAADPRSFRILVIPVPADLPADSAIQFEVLFSGVVSFVGPLSGTIPPGAPQRRHVLVTASVPEDAPAGRYAVADVRFSVAGVPRAVVPIELEVAQAYRATLWFAQELAGVRRGTRLALRYYLVNGGNGPDSLAVVVEAPREWRATVEPGTHTLAARESAEGVVTLSVPPSSSTGMFRVRLIAAGAGGERGRTAATVEVIDPQRDPGASAQRLTVGAAGVAGDTGAAGPVLGAEINGPMARGLTVSGRAVVPATSGELNPQALARVGYFLGTSYLTMAARTWHATGGTTGESFSDITGVDLWGYGGSGSWNGERWGVSALGAVPASTEADSGGGRLLGARVTTRLEPGWVVGVTATDLEDRQAPGRRLTALGVGAVTPEVRGFTLTSELARRDYGTGDGLGWLAQLDRRTALDNLRLRYAFAPGGTAAFARARTQVGAEANRRVRPNLWLGGAYWSADDESGTFSALSSSGWSLGPRYAVNPVTTLELEARHSSFDATGTAGAFGNSETAVRAGVLTRRGRFYGSGTLSLGNVARRATVSGAPTEATAGRQTALGTVGWASARGVIEGSAAFEHTGPGVGYLPQQLVLAVRADRVAVVPDRHGPLFRAELARYEWFGARPSVTTVRAGVLVPLLADFLLTVDTERNPFVRSVAGGGVPWITALKLERTFALRFSRLNPTARGVVYRDLNGNGVREAGEPGMSGVMVRRAGESVVTDDDGAFRFFGAAQAAPRIDETSLPFGVVAGVLPGAGRAGGRGIEIGAIPTGVLRVELVPQAGDDERVPAVDLTAVLVRARDAAGGYWTARADSAGVATFDALPPGRYRLELDLSGLREPLRPGGELPVFTVGPGAAPRLRIPLHPRPIRLRNGGGPGRIGAGGGRQPGATRP